MSLSSDPHITYFLFSIGSRFRHKAVVSVPDATSEQVQNLIAMKYHSGRLGFEHSCIIHCFVSDSWLNVVNVRPGTMGLVLGSPKREVMPLIAVNLLIGLIALSEWSLLS